MYMSGLLSKALRMQGIITPTPTPTPSTTLSPTDKSSRIDITGGNLIGTVSAGADGQFAGRSIGKIPGGVNINAYFEYTPTVISGSSAMCAMSNLGWSNLDKDPGDFWFGKALAIRTTDWGSNDTGSFSLSPQGTGSDTPNGSRTYGVYVRRTAGGTSTFFVRLPSGVWTTAAGDPTAAGAGHDISFFGTDDIYAMTYGQKAGDSQVFNFGGSAFVHAAAIGTVTLLS